MGWLILNFLFSGGVVFAVISYFVSFFRPRQNTAMITLAILLLIVQIISSYVGYEDGDCKIWQIILIGVLTYIPLYLLGYWIVWRQSYVCPNCGEWNNTEIIEVLAEQNYTQRVDVKRDIHNNDGEKIGSFDDSEIHDMTRKLVRIKCRSCGNISVTTIKEDLSE